MLRPHLVRHDSNATSLDWREDEDITREIEFTKDNTEVKHYSKLIEISSYELNDLTKL